MRLITPEEAKDLVGTELGVSDWLEIDQARVNGFAEITEDHQFIHTDPEKAAATPFGGTIAHGFLTLSMLTRLFPEEAVVLEGIKMGLNYGFDKVRFLAPVPVGSRIRARHMLLGIDDKGGGRWLVTTQVTIEIEGNDTPALVADWLGLQFC